MKSLRVACATNDGQTFMKEHFGDAKYYMVYTIHADSVKPSCIIDNTTSEEGEGEHAAPRKAGTIRALLQQHGVQVVVSKAFGPNIIRIKKHFVCVKVGVETLQEGVDLVRDNLMTIRTLWHQGEGREYLVLH